MTQMFRILLFKFDDVDDDDDDDDDNNNNNVWGVILKVV
jgi:hypothetical protein